MLLNSVVATMAGAILPYLSRRDTRLLRVQDEDEEEENTRLRALIYEWRAKAAKKGEQMKLPTLPVLYRTIWIGALLLFTLLTMMTFFVTSTVGVSILRPWCWSCLKLTPRVRLSLSSVWLVSPGPLPVGYRSQSLWRWGFHCHSNLPLLKRSTSSSSKRWKRSSNPRLPLRPAPTLAYTLVLTLELIPALTPAVPLLRTFPSLSANRC